MSIHGVYFTVFPQGATVTTRAHGPDISKYDQYFLPAEITGQVDFVTQRVSYGVTRDEAFPTLVPGVMQIPIRGGYHYLSSWYTWREQADKYLSYIAPYQYHYHVCDFEGAFNTLSTGFAFSAWEYIRYIQQKTGKPTLLYTNLSIYNQYIYPSQAAFAINWNEIDLWLAQYFFTPNPNGTPSTPLGRTKPWRMWQYTAQANGTLYGLARPDACDLNVYNGPVSEMRSWLGISTPPPPPDVITQLYAGLKRVSGVRHGWNFELFISDPAKVRYEAVCLAPLDTVSRVRARHGATLAMPGGEWDRFTSLKDYSVSNGGVCHVRVAAVPTLMVTNDNKIIIDHKPTPNVKQALSGLRYLIDDGVIKRYLYDPSDPLYEVATATEGHARTLHGRNAQGHHMVLVSEGVYPNQGLTLKQGADILLAHGALIAFDGPGGGDASINLDGESLIIPENINPANGQHFERPLPQVFLIYAGGTNMQYKVIWANGVSKRTGPTTSAASTGAVLGVGEIVDVVQDNIPDATYPTDPGKVWVKFTDNTYGASKYDTVRMEKVSEPEPEPEKKPERVDITLAAGSTVTTLYSDGTSETETA